MIFHPRLGQAVRLHYAKRAAAFMPYHGKGAVVRMVSQGPGPRNVAVEIEGHLVIVPRGNLLATSEQDPTRSARPTQLKLP